MAFFMRELTPVERFESTLRDNHAARQKLADRLNLVETVVGEKRAAAERLAVAGATDAKLGRAEAKLRAVEERAKTLRAELAEFDEQIASTERALADAKAQRDRDMVADQIEEMAAAIEQAAPGFGAGAAALVDAVTKRATSVLEAIRFSTSVDAVRREVLAAADLICWELRSAAVRTRAATRISPSV
jgi:chromosome segregation ATPase